MSKILDSILNTITIDRDHAAFIKKGASGTLIIEIGAKVLLFVITILLTNYLSPEDYGRYSYLMGILISLATFSTFGLDDLIIKRMGSEDQSEALSYNRSSLIVAILISILFISWFVWENPNDTSSLLVGLAAMMLTIQYMHSAMLKGRRHILSSQFPEQIVRLGSFAVIIVYYVIFRESINLELICRALVFAGFLGLVSSMILLKVKEFGTDMMPFSKGFTFFRAEVFFFAALSFFGVFRHKLDVLLLGWNEYYVETGIYNICNKLSDLILIGLVITNTLYMPLFAAQKDSPDTTDLSKVLKSSAVMNLLLGGFLLVLFLFFGRPILDIFGAGFRDGYPALILLSISTLIYVVIGPYIIMLMMVGFARDVLIGLVLGVAIQFALAMLLIPESPIYGMAISKGVAIIFIQAFMMWTAWRKLGLKPFIFHLVKGD